MNDFERKLAAQPFREPPADLRRAILNAPAPVARASWRDWLFPSPAAWGALAAVWVLLLAIDLFEPSPASPAPVASFPAKAPLPSPLLALHTPREIRHVFDSVR